MSENSEENVNPAINTVPGGDDTVWDPEIVESLYHLLYRDDLETDELGVELLKLENKYQNNVYSELIFLLSHLRFEVVEAKEVWQKIIAHRDTMQNGLGKTVDLRVAMVSYFIEVNRKLKNPKIIELKVFEQTQASAYRDELTGLCNFRYFKEHLEREILRGERYNTPFSLVMVDIDNFKDYNDRNGHQTGNQALATIAGLLREPLRKLDVPARYGGEEFALILPATSKSGAQLVAERARDMIEKYPIPYEATQPEGKLTVSMGIATYPADARSADELIRRADAALYVSKARGKNQVHLYGQNRRTYKRIHAELNGKFCVLSAEFQPLTTMNISEEGLLFLVDHKMPIGALIDVTLRLPEGDREIITSGRVVRIEEKNGKYEAAIRLLEIGTKDWNLLAKYIRETNREPTEAPKKPPPSGTTVH